MNKFSWRDLGIGVSYSQCIAYGNMIAYSFQQYDKQSNPGF